MTSELAVSPLRVKQWEACRGRMLAKLKGMAEFQAKTILEMIPDIRIIKENALWRIGGYYSFNAFCNQGLGVSRQHVYKLLSVNQDACKVLEIRCDDSNHLTVGVIGGLALEGPKEPVQETTIEPPKKAAQKPPMKRAKATVISTEANLPMHTTDLPQKANRPCPHCGGTGIAEEGD